MRAQSGQQSRVSTDSQRQRHERRILGRVYMTVGRSIVSGDKIPEEQVPYANREAAATETEPSPVPLPSDDEKRERPRHEAGPAAVESRLDAIEKGLSTLCDLFEQRWRYDEAKERAFDVLYAKMRQFEGDYQASLKKNLVLSLLLLHDHMGNVEAALAEQPDAQRYVTGLRESLIDILYAEDVEPMGRLGDLFDRHKQQALSTVPTHDPAKDNTVERVVREGFVSAGRVLRPQSVVVYRYQSAVSEEQSTEGGD